MSEKKGGRRGLLVFAVIAAAAVVTLSTIQGPMGYGTGRSDWPAQFSGNGERIYFTGTGAGGQPISARGGDRHMMMMGGAACVACHGADREGRRLRPSFWVRAPALTEEALTGTHGDDDGHAHDAYDRESLAVAITTGRRPDGSEIDPRMPRWSMAADDLADLVAYLLPGEDAH